MRVWDPATGGCERSLPGPDGYTCGKFSPTADTLVVPNASASRVRIWPISANAAERRRRSARTGDGIERRELRRDGRAHRVRRRRRAAIVVRDLASGREVTLGGAPRTVYGARVQPRRRARRGVPERGDVADLAPRPPAQRPSAMLKGTADTCNALDYSRGRPDRHRPAPTAPSASGTADGAELVVLRGHEDEVTTAVFTPDGTRVLSSSQDGTLRLWDARDGAQLAVLQSDEGELYDVALSRDGKIATLGKGEVVRVFRARSAAASTQVRALALLARAAAAHRRASAAVPRRRRAELSAYLGPVSSRRRRHAEERRLRRSSDRPRVPRSTVEVARAREVAGEEARRSSDCGPLPWPTAPSALTQSTSRASPTARHVSSGPARWIRMPSASTSSQVVQRQVEVEQPPVVCLAAAESRRCPPRSPTNTTSSLHASAPLGARCRRCEARRAFSSTPRRVGARDLRTGGHRGTPPRLHAGPEPFDRTYARARAAVNRRSAASAATGSRGRAAAGTTSRCR